MKTHDQFLELAAAAIDFGLTPAERARLDAHLAGCPLCARSAVALRADALVLAGLPGLSLPERRGAELLYEAMHPARVRHPLRLVVIAALLALLALGSLAVGAELVRRMDDDRLVVLPPATATPAPDTSAEPDAVPRPSGQLVVTHDGWIEIVSLDGGAPQRIAEGSDPTWIREGQLLFTCIPAGQQVLAVCGTDAENPGTVFTLMEEADRPIADADGHRIAIHRGMTDVGSTWLVVMDSDVVGELSAGDFHEWSPDGQWLAGQPESAAYEVAIVGADGEGFRVLGPGYDPAWSPADDRIAFGLLEAEQASLQAFDLAADESRVLYQAPAGSRPRAPRWLPDGALVFAMDGDLWRLDPGSTEPVALTTGLAVREDSFGGELDVSPDGRWVAFTTGTDDQARVGIASVDGGYELLDLGGGPASQPRWAPAPPGEPVGDTVRWRTDVVDMAAAGLRIDADGLVFTGVPSPALRSDPGSRTSWTLEAEWLERGREQRLTLYFAADQTSWWISEVRVRDGAARQADWAQFPRGPYAKTPMGAMFEGDLDLTGSSKTGPVRLRLEDLRIAVRPASQVTEPLSGGIVLRENGNPAVDGDPFEVGGPLRCSGILQLPPMAAEARLLALGYRLSWRWSHSTGGSSSDSETSARAPAIGWISGTAIGSSGELILFVEDPARPSAPSAPPPADCPTPAP
jgi:hypothetical protein